MQIPSALSSKQFIQIRENYLKHILNHFASGEDTSIQFNFVGQIIDLDQARNKVQSNPHYKDVYFKVKTSDYSYNVVADKEILENFKDGDTVEIICQFRNKLGYGKDCIEVIPQIISCRLNQTNFNVADRLAFIPQKYIKKNNIFPSTYPLTLTIIYSSSTTCGIDGDFKDEIKNNLSKLKITEKAIKMSDSKEIAEAIRTTDTDLLVIIRGGGADHHFQSFNEENVIQAFVESSAYRITGLGHHSNQNLIDLYADYNANTPASAGIHLNRKINENTRRYFEKRDLEQLKQEEDQVNISAVTEHIDSNLNPTQKKSVTTIILIVVILVLLILFIMK